MRRILTLTALPALLVTGQAGAQPVNDGPMGWGGGWGHMGGGGIFMLVFWIAILVGIFWVVTRLMRAGTDRRDTVDRENAALDILDQRYARGEIDKEEYQARRTDILRNR